LASGERLLVLFPCEVKLSDPAHDQNRAESIRDLFLPAKKNRPRYAAVTSSRLLFLRLVDGELSLGSEFALSELTYVNSHKEDVGRDGQRERWWLRLAAGDSQIELEVQGEAEGRLAALGAVLRRPETLGDERATPRVLVPIGSVHERWLDAWTDIEREAQFTEQLQRSLGDQEQLVTYLKAEARYEHAYLVEDSVADVVALTDSRLLILKIEQGGLVLLDAVPVRDVEVVEQPVKRRLQRWRAVLKVRSRTLIVKVNSAYYDELALAVSRLPANRSSLLGG
jgi:hypothetical protein